MEEAAITIRPQEVKAFQLHLMELDRVGRAHLVLNAIIADLREAQIPFRELRFIPAPDDLFDSDGAIEGIFDSKIPITKLIRAGMIFAVACEPQCAEPEIVKQNNQIVIRCHIG